jgi:nicotinate-nucleotide adenylyltransferase
MDKKHKKIGLYFGSFNPVHIGHLAIANYMLEFTDLDEVGFVVSPQNPLKNKHTLLANHHRYAMVMRAVEDYSRFHVSNIEFSLPQPSYTINTLVALGEKYPEKQFVLIMGADNLDTFYKWKNYEVILQYYQIYVYPRPGHDGGNFREHPSVHWINAPLIEISSSFIRSAIRQKKDIRFFLPDKVFKYLDEMGFYK